MIDVVQRSFESIAQVLALSIEAMAVLMVAVGAVEAVVGSVQRVFAGDRVSPGLRAIWLRFAAWILLALEFALGADVIRTAIAPSWDDIGKLGAIAVIRTGLSFFLARDIEEARSAKSTPAARRKVAQNR